MKFKHEANVIATREYVRDKLKISHGHSYCTVCGRVEQKFISGGVVIKRPNAKCPNCGSLERHRLLWLYLFDQAWPRLSASKVNLLHVAPETFFSDKLISRPDVNYISGDLTMSGAMVRLDLTNMVFWDNQFDLILCSHVLEHIPDDMLAMSELYRTLKYGGVLVVMVPIYGSNTYEDPLIIDPRERLKIFGQEDHVRKYGRDIRERLEGAGFRVRFWPERNDIAPEVSAFICSKNCFVIECLK